MCTLFVKVVKVENWFYHSCLTTNWSFINALIYFLVVAVFTWLSAGTYFEAIELTSKRKEGIKNTVVYWRIAQKI